MTDPTPGRLIVERASDIARRLRLRSLPPHVTAKRRTPNRTAPGYHVTYIDCPYCGAEHVHGDSPGHRVAHCHSPGSDGGYVIDHPAGWKDPL